LQSSCGQLRVVHDVCNRDSHLCSGLLFVETVDSVTIASGSLTTMCTGGAT
jgi:hypothetical protein